jgi:hypothetical protein
MTIAAIIVPVSSARAATARAATAHAPGLMFGGLTSQRWPAIFEVSPNGRALMFAGAALWMKCTSGDQFALDTAFARVPIRANGKFHATYSRPLTPQSDGSKLAVSQTLHGTLDHRHRTLSGIWQFDATVVSPSGQTDRCDSGAVRIHAVQ